MARLTGAKGEAIDKIILERTYGGGLPGAVYSKRGDGNGGFFVLQRLNEDGEAVYVRTDVWLLEGEEPR